MTHPNSAVVAWTLCERELVRFLRQRNRVFAALGQPIIFWFLFSEGLRASGLGYEHFFPGTLVMILLFTAIFATVSVIEDRREGFLQSVLVAPIAGWSMVLGKIMGGTLLALGQGLVFLLLGWLTVGVDVTLAALPMLVLLMGLIAFGLTSLGFLIAWQMDSTQGFHAIMMVFLLPMWLLSGAFFPPDAGWLTWVVQINPLTYGVMGLRWLLQSGQGAAAMPGVSWQFCWFVTVLFALGMYAMASVAAGRRTTGDLL